MAKSIYIKVSMKIARVVDAKGKVRFLAVEGTKKVLEAVAAQCGVKIIDNKIEPLIVDI
jgi:hypothetical protein